MKKRAICCACGTLMLLGVIASGWGQATPSDPADLVAAREKYESELRDALAPIRERYLRRLEAMQKSMTRAGDLKGATAVAEEIERVNSTAADLEPLSPYGGVWTLRYENGAVRTYEFRGNEVVRRDDGKASTGRLFRNGGDVLLDFGDGKLERLTLKPVLQVEHFSPKELYRTGKANIHASGERAP